MALANIFGWNRQDKAQTSAACGTACGQQTSLRRNLQLVERHAEQQTSLRRNPQPVAQHVALPISK